MAGLVSAIRENAPIWRTETIREPQSKPPADYFCHARETRACSQAATGLNSRLRRNGMQIGFAYAGIVIGAAAAISGLGAALGVLHWPLVIGLSVTLGCVILAALGLKIARGGPAGGL